MTLQIEQRLAGDKFEYNVDLCPHYLEDNIRHLLQEEERVQYLYSSPQALTSTNRAYAIEWLVRLKTAFDFDQDILIAAVSIFDKIVLKTGDMINCEDFQVIATACLAIALKTDS